MDADPDVLLVSAWLFQELVREGMLLPLKPYIQSDDIPLDEMAKGVVDKLRNLGGGKLFGLTPGFESKALYVNTDLFKRFDIALPKEDLTQITTAPSTFGWGGCAFRYSLFREPAKIMMNLSSCSTEIKAAAT